MRGSVAKKGKRWYAVVYDGVDPATGKYRRRWVPAGTRRGDAEKLLADLVKRSHEGNTVLHPRDDMAVLLQRERRCRATEPLTRHFHRDASTQADGGVRVTQVVKADAANAGLLDPPLEGLSQDVRMDDVAVVFAEHQAVLHVGLAVRAPLNILKAPVLSKHLGRSGVEVDHAAAWVFGVDSRTS